MPMAIIIMSKIMMMAKFMYRGLFGVHAVPSMTVRSASTPYARGSSFEASCSHPGTFSPVVGNSAPLRKNRGRLMNVCMAPKFSRLPMKLAIIRPMLTSPKVISSITGRAASRVRGLKGMPIRKPNAKTIIPWSKAAVLSPSILPRNILNRDMGATRISFMKPNSLSQITLMPMNMAVNSRVWPMIPGKRNC